MNAENPKKRKEAEESEERVDQRKESKRAMSWLAGSILFGLFIVILFSFQANKITDICAISSVGIMAAGASLLAGGVLGFLFGIPKTIQKENTAGNNKDKNQSDQNKEPSLKYSPNTNLEEISDWLTKMIIGVGLTQLYVIPGKLKLLIEYLGTGLGESPYNQAYALALLLYFIAIGFLFGYLWTKLFYKGALLEADLLAINNMRKEYVSTTKRLEETIEQKYESATKRLEETGKELNQIKEFKNLQDLEKEALALTSKQLYLGRGEPSIDQDELNSAIASASESIKVQIFSEASQVRYENWKNESTKHRMERTIPIFRALISSDPTNHKYHGQLGFALKDQTESNWSEAKEELSKAIELRRDWKKGGWLYYEFNRAYCRIMLDSAFKQKKSSDAMTKEDILNDLKTASNDGYINSIIASDPVVQEWMQINGIPKIEP